MNSPMTQIELCTCRTIVLSIPTVYTTTRLHPLQGRGDPSRTRTSHKHPTQTRQQCHPLLMIILGNQFTAFCFSSPGNPPYPQNVSVKIGNRMFQQTVSALSAKVGRRNGGLVDGVGHLILILSL